MAMDPFSLLVAAVVGLAATTLVMWACARLAGIQRPTLRASLLAAAGYGLPLAAVVSAWQVAASDLVRLGLLGGAVLLGLAIVRAAYRTTWGKAAMTWVMNACATVLLMALVLRRG